MRSFAFVPCSIRAVVAVGLAALSCGCAGTQARGLRITEVGRRAIELYVDEPSGSLTLGGGQVLTLRTHSGATSSVSLGTFGAALPAGTFAMVWSEAGYLGPIVVEPYSGGQQGAVTGIKVPTTFFTDVDSSPTEVRLTGSRNRVSGLLVIFPLFTEDHVDDVVRFGLPEADRPQTGGTFQSNGSLESVSGSSSHARSFQSGRPVDTDAEADWRNRGITNWGVPTP